MSHFRVSFSTDVGRWAAIMACGVLLAAGAPGAIQGQGVSDDRSSPDPEFRIVEDESVVGVVTRRAGAAARLAHDHLIHAGRLRADLHFVPDDPSQSRFRLTVRAAELEVDHASTQERVQHRLIELGILDGPFQDVRESQRRDIRVEMLDEGQLDAVNHPVIEVETRGIRDTGEGEHPFEIEAEMTVRGEVRPIELTGRIEAVGEGLFRIEAFGETTFSEFGIRPFRAFMGAVQNQDRFFLYMDLTVQSVR